MPYLRLGTGNKLALGFQETLAPPSRLFTSSESESAPRVLRLITQATLHADLLTESGFLVGRSSFTTCLLCP